MALQPPSLEDREQQRRMSRMILPETTAPTCYEDIGKVAVNKLYEEMKNLADYSMSQATFTSPRYNSTGRSSYSPAEAPRTADGYQGYKSGYTGWKYDREVFRKVIRYLARDLPGVMQQAGADFIVVQGTSGIFAAAAVQMLIDVPVMMLRKENEDCHASNRTECGEHLHKRGIIIDDFIASGSTMHKIIRQLPRSCEVAGIMLYHGVTDGYEWLKQGNLFDNRYPVWKYR